MTTAKVRRILQTRKKINKILPKKVSFSNKQYSFEVTKIEVLDDMSNTSNGVGKANNGLYPLTKLLKDVEKSYDKGEKTIYSY